MIPVRVETPAAAVPVRGGSVAMDRGGRSAPAFDKAMREQETGAQGGGIDAPGDKDELSASPVPDVGAEAPPPVPLDTLIAQMLPAAQQQPAQQPQAEPTQATTPQSVAQLSQAQQVLQASQLQTKASHAQGDESGEADKASLTGASDGAAGLGQDLEEPSAHGVEGARTRQKSPGAGDRDPSAARGSAPGATPAANPDRSARAGRGESEPGDGSTTRRVAVRNVSTATHFPVTADPVRQIANEVTRALEAPAPTSPAEAQASPVKTVNIQLQPESLGTVTLRMRLSGDSLSVRVDVAEPATLELISRERDRLQKSMATESVSIDRLEIRAAGESAPVTGGDNANAPKQDMNAPGQQSRQNTTAQGGEQRRDGRGDSQQRTAPRHGFENDSARSDDSRGVYL